MNKLSADQLKTLHADANRETRVNYYHGPEYYARLGAREHMSHFDARWSLNKDQALAFCLRRRAK